ncbi:MAG: ribosome small subunit-dependent GTPase A, partial [Cyanobacteria bacterium HKST-UBA05]|nr:ribosome small subunit-dependent GTPase A [Cyanobacteria bacterium HKST-UBA05]
VAVDTRQSQLSRPKVANVKQVLVVCATRQPDLDPQQLDRYLTHVTLAGLTPLICFNKVDLLDPEALQTLESIKARYEALGIAVVLSSIFQPHSIATLRQQLGDTSTVLAGASGVGKSSLINALLPQAELDVKAVSSKQQRGRHTTRSVTLLPLTEQTTEQAAGQAGEAEKNPLSSTIVDSPGFSYLKFDQVTPQQLEASFPEFAPLRPACRYNNCLHEPHQTTAVEDEAYCAVLANADQLDTARLASYHTFLAEAHAAQDTLAAQGNTEEATYKTLHGGKGKDQDLRILKLKTKQRAASRRKERQQLSTMTLDEFDPRMQDDLD